MTYKLFLDDVRNPIDVLSYRNNEIYKEGWIIARNYDEFVKIITEDGLPYVISFDHDLADSHYTPQHLWDDYNESKKWQESQIHTEKTGKDCAQWLIDYCAANDRRLPICYVHSMNPVGADNIINVLKNHHLKNTL